MAAYQKNPTAGLLDLPLCLCRPWLLAAKPGIRTALIVYVYLCVVRQCANHGYLDGDRPVVNLNITKKLIALGDALRNARFTQ